MEQEPAQPVPPSNVSLVMPNGAGSAPPGSAVPDPNAPKEAKNDQFYRYWDRFNLSTKSRKTAKKKKEPAVVSLDTDLEGNPSHHQGLNDVGIVTQQKATTSFKEAEENCKAKVAAIVAECKRLNMKYYDRNFDVGDVDALVSLNASQGPLSIQGIDGIGSVKRVEDIFTKPQFFIDGATADDVRQGATGDCWFLAALTALSGKPELIERLCVARDEKVGVYGFVFYRDGEWISEVVDDRLCVAQRDEHSQFQTEFLVRVQGDKNVFREGLQQIDHRIIPLSKDLKETLRKGSDTLYFASCKDSNETWLPFIEKAYAKAHGDYQAIESGYTGEGIEDLTGGVSAILFSEDILDKDKLWNELLQANESFLFGCSSRRGSDDDPQDDEGFVRGHAYTVLQARELKDKDLRLLKVRNPWGRQEWNGAWSDGAKEWTAEMIKELDHTFGDDGVFWISFQDFLRYFPMINRVRLFGPEWTVNQQWVAVDVPWIADYLDTKFDVKVTKAGPVVLVLSQPDDRYFRGLQGRYCYYLHFRVYEEGKENYLLRSMECSGQRSTSAELDLEPGIYHIHVKITATRDNTVQTAEETIKKWRVERRDKLLSTGKSFDLTHSKGRLREAEKAHLADLKDKNKQETKKMLQAQRELSKQQRQRKRLRRNRILGERDRKREAKKKAISEKAETNPEAKPEENKSSEPEEAKEILEKPTESTAKNSAKGNTDVSGSRPGTDKHVEEPKETIEEPEKAAEEPKKGVEETEKKVEGPEKTVEEPGKIADSRNETVEDKSMHAEKGLNGESAANVQTKDHEDSTEKNEDNVPKKGDEVEDGQKAEPDLDGEDGPAPLGMPEGYASSVSSIDDDDFDWDSSMDGPVEDDESEDDEDLDPQAEIFADDPWNATCVVGLRVYSKESDVEITVVRDSV